MGRRQGGSVEDCSDERKGRTLWCFERELETIAERQDVRKVAWPMT